MKWNYSVRLLKTKNMASECIKSVFTYMLLLKKNISLIEILFTCLEGTLVKFWKVVLFFLYRLVSFCDICIHCVICYTSDHEDLSFCSHMSYFFHTMKICSVLNIVYKVLSLRMIGNISVFDKILYLYVQSYYRTFYDMVLSVIL
jgi:hypothetical protein